MAGAEVRVERPLAGVGMVVLDRPEVRNALGWDTWPQLTGALDDLAGDHDVRAVVLTGTGGVFSAGGDVKSMGPAGNGALAPAARLMLAQRALQRLIHLPKPTVAAVEGYAIGAAWGLVLACDLVVAATDAFFAAPFMHRGLVPDAGTGWFLSRAVGRHRASELLFLGDRLPAAEAAGLGLANRLVAPGEAIDEAVTLAGRLAQGPPDTLALTKAMLRRSAATSLEHYLEEEILNMALNGHGADADEGRQSFLEKRPAHFGRPPAPGAAGRHGMDRDQS